MSFYLYLNLAIIAFPLVFSFERRLKFYSRFKPLSVSLILVGCIFVGWDIFATYRGHWSFNSSFVNELSFLGLPLGEILFFITVPYSCLFIFESIRRFLGDRSLFSSKKWFFTGIGILMTAVSFAFLQKEYTFLAILSVGLTLLFVSFVKVKIFSSRAYWIYIIITLLLFIVVNFILTSLPVVQYSSSAISGFRVITIPIEDFLFNFSMLTAYAATYTWALDVQKKK
ncbi:MAG: lycopene cyclase domain-containing protein [Candidatus Bathyarchaeota archaeon]|nr:MAG: lycopene cyclase domain-containing protein [Candidatus Bathyarchaeota archaeon]